MRILGLALDTSGNMKVNVKWGKELFKDVEIDLAQPPVVFKTQLFTLSLVPPERQKIMIKGGLLKDDDWGKQVPKEGMTLMMMGSADAAPVQAPANAPTFVEDLPEHEQENLDTKQYGAGLHNLGNTCYLNSTVQCLYSVGGLRKALASYQASPTPSVDTANKLVAATKDLFKDLEKGGAPFPPFRFLLALREKYPQFAQQADGGVYMQQDAEECFTQLMYTLREKLKDTAGASVVEKLFGIGVKTTLKCEESSEEFQESSTNYTLKCNISNEVNYLHQGIALALKEDREKNSEALGKLALFKGVSALTTLPPYLTVQMVRFFYKADVQQKAKILRKVTFPLELDCYDYCSDELKQKLDGPRQTLKDMQDKKAEEDKSKAVTDTAKDKSTTDVEMTEASPSTSALSGDFTGKYQLQGVLTHKGRSADSGHYVAWVKQEDGTWVLFDDDQLLIKKDEDILALSGGGDWHMAYLLVYRAITVPPSAEPSPQN